MSEASAAAASSNRRECFRINDRVALRMRVLGENEYRAALAGARCRNERRSVLNSIITAGEKSRGALRGVRAQSPALASYLQGMDERIEALARLMSREGSNAPDEPTHNVNISGTGIRFFVAEPLPRGTHVELDIQLFPSHTCLRLYGTVVWCEREKRGRSRDAVAVAVDYSDMHEDERELLIRHIHGLQLDHVRRNADID